MKIKIRITFVPQLNLLTVAKLPEPMKLLNIVILTNKAELNAIAIYMKNIECVQLPTEYHRINTIREIKGVKQFWWKQMLFGHFTQIRCRNRYGKYIECGSNEIAS